MVTRPVRAGWPLTIDLEGIIMREFLADIFGGGARVLGFILLPIAVLASAFSGAVALFLGLAGLALIFGGRWLVESSEARAGYRYSKSADRVRRHESRQQRVRDKFRGL